MPYDQIEKAFTDSGTGVFLPYREFLDLWNQLQIKRSEEDSAPPTDGVISRIEYSGAVEGQTLSLTAKISAESFKSKGWAKLALGSGAIAGIAQAQTGKAVLNVLANGSAELLLPEKGAYDITLQFMLPVATDNGKSAVQLALPRASISKAVIIVPGDNLNFEVKPSAAFTSRALAPGQTELSFFFGGTGATPEITWGTPHAVTQMTPLLLADTKLECTIHPGSLATSVTFDFKVLRAPMNEFKISLPADNEALGVTGQGIKTWNVTPGAQGHKTLVVTPDKPVSDAFTFALNLESPIAALPAAVQVPDLVVEGANYARGTATLRTEPQFDVTAKTLDAAVRDSATAAPPAGLIAAGSFRLLKQPYKLALSVEEAKPQVEVKSATRVEIARDNASISTQFNVNVRRVGIFETRIALPDNLTVSDVKGDKVAEWKIDTNAKPNVLNVKLSAQTQGDIAFALTGRQLRATPTTDFTVPMFVPQDVARHEATVGITVHSSLEVNTSKLGDLTQDDVAAINYGKAITTTGTDNVGNPTTITLTENRVPQNQTNLGFKYRDTAKVPATLAFKLRDPQVTVQVLTLVEAREQSTKHAWTLDFDVAYAAIDSVILAVPTSIAAQVRLIDPSIKEIKKNKFVAPADPKLAMGSVDGYDSWTVVFRSEKIGSFQFTLNYEKQGALEAGKTGKIDLLQVHVPFAFQEVGQVAVLKDNALELRNPQPEGLEEIDARELTGPLAKPGVFQAFKYRTLPIKLSLETAKNAYFPVPQAIITHADLTTAVASDNAQTTEVIYWVKNIDLQFLVVKLPPNAALDGYVNVGKESQQPMRREGSDELLVRLPTGGSAQRDAFPVRFVYQSPSADPGHQLGTWGSLQINPPTAAGINVLQTRHRLFLPDGKDYTAFDGPLELPYTERGWPYVWRTFKSALWYAPVDAAFSLVFRQPDSDGNSRWTPPPRIADDVRTSFDHQIPEQGHAEELHRLGAPAEISAHYRSRSVGFFWEAIAFGIVAIVGWLGHRWSASGKMTFFIAGTVLAMLAIGLFSTANAVIGIGIIRGVGVVVLLWLALAVKHFISRFRLRRKNGNGKPPPPAKPGISGPASPGGPVPSNPPGTSDAPKPDDPDASKTTAADDELPAMPAAAPRASTARSDPAFPMPPSSSGATTASSSGPTEFIELPEVSDDKP